MPPRNSAGVQGDRPPSRERVRRAATGSFDIEVVREAERIATNPTVKSALGEAIEELEFLRSRIQLRKDQLDRLKERERRVSEAELRRVELQDGGSVLVLKSTKDGDYIVFPDGRVYEITNGRYTILLSDGGP